jgi:hypothetical protein
VALSTCCENDLSEGSVALQNSFAIMSLVDLNPILSRSFPSSFQPFKQNVQGALGGAEPPLRVWQTPHVQDTSEWPTIRTLIGSLNATAFIIPDRD